ncbi:MAG TPA: hypothetical protein VI749_00160 [Candidatus Omnitrophota bacterium]|nr:hypothetical protein [Candidatus Omnitrophota bacterium]
MRDSFYRITVVVLLATNTFFLGGIWCTLKYPYGTSKSSFCPFGSKAGKMCPITGKVLQSSSADAMKGPATQ